VEETAVPLASPPSSQLALVRFVAGLSQAGLARKAGLSRETVGNVERGSTPRLDTARALARALSVDVSTLFPDIEEGAPSANGTPSESPGAGTAADAVGS
jgi:transcriptional regulator with XRE-family HTH domain